MSVFTVRPDTEQALRRRMAELEISEDDLEERFIRGSGAGGQKRNKTSSCVQLRHLPSGVEVRCQRERSQAMNRYFARVELCDRIEAMRTGEVQRKAAAISKARRQKQRRSRRTKVKLLAAKRERGKTKSLRRKPSSDD